MKKENIDNFASESLAGIADSVKALSDSVKALEKENAELKARLGDSETTESNPEAPQAFDCLAVTNVQVWPFSEGPSLGHMKGLAQIVINDQLVIRGMRIMEGEYGLFVSYPLDPFYKGEDYRSVVNPITRALREHIEACVLEKYNAVMEGQGGSHD